MKVKGKVYSDSDGRLKIVFDKHLPLPRGRVTLLITRVNGKPLELEFEATITHNDPYRSKCRIPPFPELRPGAVVEGYIEEELRCKWCSRLTSSLINGLCDDCFVYFYSPYG